MSLSNGGYLVIEQTEALVSIDVNGGQCMLGHGTSQEKAILDVNLAAAKQVSQGQFRQFLLYYAENSHICKIWFQIARELRLRDIGGIIVVDFIDMWDDCKSIIYISFYISFLHFFFFSANKRLVYEEVKKAVERDRSLVKVSELSRHGLMEITRKRVCNYVSKLNKIKKI